MVFKQNHLPVLLEEVVTHLCPQRGSKKPRRERYVLYDGTVGAGGHVAALLEALTETETRAWVIGTDRDSLVLKLARQRLHDFLFKKHQINLVHSAYSNLPGVMAQVGLEPGQIDGILLDLGANSIHFDNPERGFSFSQPGPLDMRYDTQQSKTAKDLLLERSEEELCEIIRVYGEERWAKVISKAIKRELARDKLETTKDLAELIFQTIPRKAHPKKIHPATKTFQALRIAVNQELEHLQKFLEIFPDWLKKGGRVGFISFHSLEDRMVKRALQKYESPCECPKDLPVCQCGKKPILKFVKRRVIQASAQEIRGNPRSRSAKLRVAEKV